MAIFLGSQEMTKHNAISPKEHFLINFITAKTKLPAILKTTVLKEKVRTFADTKI
jgi:hypothetical protein